MNQQLHDKAEKLKKQVRRVLAQHHPDKGGDKDRFLFVKVMFDECSTILDQSQNCPPVMVSPFLTTLDRIEKELSLFTNGQSGGYVPPASKTPSPSTPTSQSKPPSSPPVSNPGTTSPNIPKPNVGPINGSKGGKNKAPQSPTSPPNPVSSAKPLGDPNKQLYRDLGDIVEFLNNELFGGVLPLPVIKLQSKPNMIGYMTGGKNWQQANTNITTYELGLNPMFFQGRPLSDIFNTIAHELAHEYCSEVYSSSTQYHDKKWTNEAIKIGLIPVGKGLKVDTKIRTGGLLDIAYKKFMRLNPGFKIDWFAINPQALGGVGANNSKTKYTCPNCGLNAWAKPKANLACGDCLVKMV